VYVGNDVSIARKIREGYLAWQMEHTLSKEQILTKYLNTVYFGNGAYGIQAAARSYFAIDAKDLTLSQSALLAGLIRAPNDFDPFAHPVHARVRRNTVLRQMLDQSMITEAERDEAVAEPIELHAFTSCDRYPFPYFVDYFKQWFLSNPAFGETREDRYQLLFTGGLRITTAGQVLDTNHQPIPGLYAAGEMVGGLFYFNYPGGSGLMSGAVFGRIAGSSAGRAAKR